MILLGHKNRELFDKIVLYRASLPRYSFSDNDFNRQSGTLSDFFYYN